ncbi:MAG: glutamate 5-kinase [Myxococcota bacterium]|jgi:glutamate 5-kinase|nr:glutamate 5-kinase [Myxococcota bacterium]
MSDNPRAALTQARRVVIKVGTGVVTRSDGALALGRLGRLVENIADLRAGGREVLLVSSGAVGLGAQRLGLDTPRKLIDRQACAAAGQGALVGLYNDLFERLGLLGAQVLLTETDFSDRTRYQNLNQTLERLLRLGVVPIINENDTVSTAELAMSEGQVFGDNDRLSALLASRVDADALILLTNVDGIHTLPPGQQGSELVPVFDDAVTIQSDGPSEQGRGGMTTKIEAAQVATHAGVTVVVASGMQPDTPLHVLAGEPVGTVFPPRMAMKGRKRWLAFASSVKGTVVVNEGAHRALLDQKASLLPRGVVRVEGEFIAGDVVAITTENGVEVGRGRCNLTSGDARAALGLHSSDLGRSRSKRCMIHRDHIAILEEVNR